MKKFLLIFALINISIFAQSAGNTGLAFLKNGFGARNIAMGDLGVVAKDNLTGAYYNPALIAGDNNSALSFSHNQLIQDVSGEMFGAGFDLFGLNFAAVFNTTSISDIEIRHKPGEAESTFNAHYFSGSLGTGFFVMDNLAAGISVKYLFESLYTNNASGLAFDFGFVHSGLVENLELGLSVSNLGSMDDLRNEATKLPAGLRIGGAYIIPLEQIEAEVTVQTGLQKYIDTDDTHIHSGFEFMFRNLVAIRAGYITGYETKDLTAGIGLNWMGLAFDYAFIPMQYNLGDNHIISLQYNF